MLNDQQIQEIRADINYFVSQLINEVKALQQEVDYLKGQNQILKQQLDQSKFHLKYIGKMGEI